MFSYLEDPIDSFFSWGNQQLVPEVQQVPNYFDAIEERLNQVMNEGFGNNSNDEEDQIQDSEDDNQDQQPSVCQSYFSSTQSTYDGNNFVQEHRERLADANGKVRFTTQRRLGDRWFESESITDENGETSSKETWHNVPEDGIEQFKQDWAKQYNTTYSNPLSIEHQKEE